VKSDFTTNIKCEDEPSRLILNLSELACFNRDSPLKKARVLLMMCASLSSPVFPNMPVSSAIRNKKRQACIVFLVDTYVSFSAEELNKRALERKETIGNSFYSCQTHTVVVLHSGAVFCAWVGLLSDS
jgi:hypothetical protein